MNAMLKFLALAAPWLLAFPTPQPGADTLPVTDASAAGLALHWQSQIQADTSRDEIVDLCLHVHDDRATSYYEIRYDGVRETIGFDDVGPRGNPLGKDGAREAAELRKEILEAEGRADVAIELVTTPETSIYALSGFGDVQAINAETGGTRWKIRVGDPFQPSVGIAANDQYVVVLKGSTVHCIDASNGNVEWSRLCRHAPGGGVAVSDYFAYVTSVRGHLQMFPLATRGLPEKFFASSGAALVDPTVSPKTVSWATDRGYFNVASSDERGRFLFRLKTDEKFQAGGARAGDYLVVVSIYGKAYAVHETDGILAWEIAVGEPVSRQPINIGDNRLAVISSLNHLMILDAKRGQFVPEWPRSVPGIREYVGASQDVLYFIDVVGRLVGLRRDTGSQVLQLPLGEDIRVIANFETDRMYLTDPAGHLVCIRELSNVNPVVLSGDKMVAAADSPADSTEAARDLPAATDDPFGNPVDSPGDPGKAASDPADPFGQGMSNDKPDDPFAGDQTDKPDDPFADDDSATNPDQPPSDDDSGDPPPAEDPDDPFGGG